MFIFYYNDVKAHRIFFIFKSFSFSILVFESGGLLSKMQVLKDLLQSVIFASINQV